LFVCLSSKNFAALTRFPDDVCGLESVYLNARLQSS
jgi:hypothetical protein